MNTHLSDLEALSHAIPLAKRKELGEQFDRLAEALGLSSAEVRHLTWPTPSWPRRAEGSATRDDVYRYSVDFGHGEQPDYRSFAATFDQVRQLLNYTKDSCKVAFGTNKGVIDRVTRPTKLGPCIITRLPHPIDLDDYPDVFAFEVKLQEALASAAVGLDGAGRPRVKPAGGNKY